MSKFILTLDDYSPDNDNLLWADKLIDRYPTIKIDLFLPAAYCRLGGVPQYLSNNIEWINKVRQLSSNYSINLHGMFHRRSKKDFNWHKGIESNNNEWENLTYRQASDLLDMIEGEFNKVGLKYSKIFRPPGWYLGLDAARLLTDRGFIIVGDVRHHNICKKIKKIKWINFNWDMAKECNLVKGDVLAFGHTSSWTNNYMDEGRLKLIIKLLEKRDFEFKFIEELYN